MASSGKPDATGRSSGKHTGRRGKATRPPKNEPWIWHTREMIRSEAWRAASINTRRLLDFLEVEHCNHAGTDNGNLKATHDQLREFGLSSNSIRPAIEEAEFLGLLSFQRGGRWGGSNQPSTYRLTYLPDREQNAPTNDWRNRTKEQIDAWRDEQRSRRKGARVKKQKAALNSATTVPSDQRVPSPLRVVGKT